MLIGGYFYKSHLRPEQGFRIFNTWLGDPSKLILLEKVVEIVKRDNLLQNIAKTGDSMLSNLKALAKRYPDRVMNPRGVGTYCAVDFSSPDFRNTVVQELHKAGIHCGGSGVQSLRVRTSLTFNTNHSDIFADRFDRVMKKLVK